MNYKYKMVQAPKNLHLKNVPSSSGVAEGYLQSVVVGQKETYTVYKVITFRRDA